MSDVEVKKYPDGTEIKQFPKWVYPGGKPEVSGDRRHVHNGVLVQNKMELEQALIKFGDKPGLEPDTKEKAGWAK